MEHLKPVEISDIFTARKRISPHITPTHANNYPALDHLFGGEVWVKHENHHHTGAFKVRGGINLCAAMSKNQRKRGIVGASTGNHGQSLAYAASLFDMKAQIFVPEESNPEKIRAMKHFGAEIVYFGENYETCRRQAKSVANEQGMRFVSGGNEPLLIAGVGTYALELFEHVPDLDVLYVPVGGGSGACGCCVAGQAVSPKTKIIGVQSTHASAVYQSWKTGEEKTTETADTFAEGLATLAAFRYPLQMLRTGLDDFVLVDDDELRQAVRLLFTYTHNVAEGAGAAAFAAAYRDRKSLAGRKVGVIMSGGNLTLETLTKILVEK